MENRKMYAVAITISSTIAAIPLVSFLPGL